VSELVGAVEAGGTKFRAAVYDRASLELRDEVRIETTTPDATLGAVLEFFQAQPPVAALGIASFGPLIVDAASGDYGSVAATPKPGWTGAKIFARLQAALGVPAEIQTDVEAAAVAEYQRGAGQGQPSLAYVTVGTGIGVGVAIDGVPFRGRDHLELGHIPVRRHPDDTFEGRCPFHGDCLEGLACGPALIDRWETRPSSLPEDHLAWEIEAYYLAQLVRVLAYSFSPDRVLFSGGVGARPHLAAQISQAAIDDLAGYSVSHQDNQDLVQTALLGNDAGLTGAAMLATSLL